MITMPDLTNLSLDVAKTTLKNNKLVLGKVTEDYSDDVEEGLVCSQSVLKDKDVKVGATINLVISLGPKDTDNSEGDTGDNTDNNQDGNTDNPDGSNNGEDNSDTQTGVDNPGTGDSGSDSGVDTPSENENNSDSNTQTGTGGSEDSTGNEN